MTDHVEAVVAERMRAPNGPRDVTLVLNNPPCTRGRFGCDKILRDLIPKGSRTTVYVKDSTSPNDVRLHDVYEGTGRAIAR